MKKDIMGVKKINVLVGDNSISYSKINGNGNDFMDNLYEDRLSMFDK
jgi:hypothetical protein